VGNKKRKKKKKGNQLASNLRTGFSPTQQAGAPARGCPLKKTKPCNLKLLRLTEPVADISGKPGTRSAEVRLGQTTTHRCCPALLDSGGVFQITAQSDANPPRTLKVEAVTEAICSGATHPELAAMDSAGAHGLVAKQTTLKFSRMPMSGDSGLAGLWVVLNSVFQQSPVDYFVSAATCGCPASPSGTAVADLRCVVQVFPADVYELEFSLPALLKPEALSYEKKSEEWETVKDQKKKEIEAAGDLASEEYKSSAALQQTGSEGEFRSFFEDLKKKQLGEEDPKYYDEITVKLTQKDGSRSLEAPVQDIINLIRAIDNAEYAFKQIQDWIENFQVGPGVSFKVECQFLAGRVSAKWGYTEYTDDRVFFAYAGGIKIDLIKASMDVNAGWKCAGLADAFLFINGEGTISFNAPEIAKESPDEAPKASLKPEGELKLSGGVQGALGWIITGSVKFEVAFKADTEDFKVLCDDGIFGGKVVISREPVFGQFTVTLRLWGSKTHQIVVAKGNPNLAEFDLS
jgi:hypothetical protein